MFVALVIVPLTIDHAYVVAPAGPLALLPVELVVTKAGAVIVGTAGVGFTVNTAVVSAKPDEFVKWARYRLPLADSEAGKVNGEVVAPPISVNVDPPSVDTRHCRAGAGYPLAAAVKVAFEPSQTVVFAAAVVIDVASFTVNVKFCCALPAVFVAVNVSA